MIVGVVAEMRSGHFSFKSMFIYEELRASNYWDDHIKEKEVLGHIARKRDLIACKILMKRNRKLGKPRSRWEFIWPRTWRTVLKTIIITGVP